ncbi:MULTISPECIES: preprotein translocase subunit SecE [Citricoccus]|uniref:Protein translocase subunit SecE n=1 Tax=Citricoccus muralis TaxID=169134 RepID=A0ABY8H430_9MICC|nr:MULTISPECIES: preprotein translocase subunit SecE [Citricoccus]WBL20543.1 preprotein translocase subunit SecE [Citricoccus sp. NR2]WFP15892.1 preprotein translocase subunit SecE [Citricoccus muralis]
MSEVVAQNGGHDGSGKPQKRGVFGRLMLFLRQVVDELKKVVTPTREELIKMTGVVLVFVVIVVLLVTGLDWLFGTGASFIFGTPDGL